MSNQLRIAARRAFARAPGVIGHYPCFQTASEGAFMTDRSGAGNGAAFGAALSAATGWGTANRLTVVDNNAGSQAGGPFLSAAQLALNLNTESFIISGIFNASSLSRPAFGFGEISGAGGASNGFNLRANPTTGFANAQVCFGAAGATQLGTASDVNISTGSDVHVGLAYDATTKRLWTLVAGALNAAANGTTGWDVSSFVAQMGVANGGTALGNLVFGGAPRGASGNQQVWACTSYGWQVAKRTGALPANLPAVVARLARHPLQVLTATEWPA